MQLFVSLLTLAEENRRIFSYLKGVKGFPGGSVVKNPPVNSGNAGSIPGLGRFPRVENGNSFQYSCLGNPTQDFRGAWQATIHGVTKELETT